MLQFRIEKMPAISGRKICRQFQDGKYAGNFGTEDMPAISGRKICRRFRVEKKIPAKSDRNKMSANSGRKKIPASLGRKKMPVFSGGDKIAGKPAIAGELTGLSKALYTEVWRKFFDGKSISFLRNFRHFTEVWQPCECRRINDIQVERWRRRRLMPAKIFPAPYFEDCVDSNFCPSN